MSRSGVRPTDGEMVALGEELVEAARSCIESAISHGRLFSGEELRNFERLGATVHAWDDAMVDRFQSAIEEAQDA